MKILPRAILVATTAAIAFPLSLWLSETFHVDCRRGPGERFDCVVESSKRGSTRVYSLDQSRLRSARLDVSRTQHTDGSVDEHHRLKLVLIGGQISSEDGDPDTIRANVERINGFIASPAEKEMRFTMSNRHYRLALAAIMVVTMILLTQDFSRLCWRRG